jgi:hypothetical protein
MAAAAITPRASETAFIPASFPGVNFTGGILLGIFAILSRPLCAGSVQAEGVGCWDKDDGNLIVA